ncbi:MAG: HupE/UreJ family protein [Blastocatellia bacterium]
MNRSFLTWLILCFAFLLTTRTSVLAHDPGMSAVTLQKDGAEWRAQLTFARADIESLAPVDADHNGQVSPDELNVARAGLQTLMREQIQVSVDGAAVGTNECEVSVSEGDGLRFDMRFPAAAGKEWQWRSGILEQLPSGHRQFLALRNGANETIGARLLDRGAPVYTLDLSSLPAEHGAVFRRFLALGVEHILLGWDHLAFLLALLITGARLREAGKIITSFTLAHSITLSLATLGAVQLPATIVEPLIAVSIIYVAIENLLRKAPRGRTYLTFAFGLIHGFGFAGALGELGIGANSGGIAVPLLSFNLGVELGQIAIAALTLPLVWKLQTRASLAPRLTYACSLLIAVAGGWWLVQRTLL